MKNKEELGIAKKNAQPGLELKDESPFRDKGCKQKVWYGGNTAGG